MTGRPRPGPRNFSFGVRVIGIPGYELVTADRARVIALARFAHAVRDALRAGSLYEHAAAIAAAGHGIATLRGRAPLYAIPFGPLGEPVAIRRTHRGGLFRGVLRDRFLPPTRGTRELVASFRLRLLGVPTPEVIAVASYRAGPVLRRADVVTSYVPGADLAAVLGDARNDAQRRPLLDAVAELLALLARAGAQHPDLNLRNILIASVEDRYAAYVLDVDRVHFHVPGDPLVARANLDRLLHSLRRWRALPTTRRGALPDEDIAHLALAVAAPRV